MTARMKSKTKYYCSDKEKLKSFMVSQGFIFKNSTLEVDEYYIDTKFNMLEKDNCIRIRTLNNKECVLSFEGIVENLSPIDLKDEQNTFFDISQKENMSNFLNCIGYYKYVSMNILKETYVKKDKEYYYSISIDTIENVGEFVDFDIYTEADNNGAFSNRYYEFESNLEKCLGEKTNARYRDFVSIYFYQTQLKGDGLTRILVELDKIFVNINTESLEESIKNNKTMLNLELIERLEQKGIKVEIVYSGQDDVMVNAIKKIIDRIGYTPTFLNIKEIKEISVKETLIIEKQKKIDFSQIAFMILTNRK